MQKNKLSNYDKATIQAFNKGYDITKDGRIKGLRTDYLSLYEDRKGYLGFSFTLQDGTHTRVKVHKMQAYKKFGDKIFRDGIRVRHLNNDKEDNSYNNIGLGYPSDIYPNNIKTSKEEGKEYGKKLTSKEVKEISDLIKNSTLSYHEIGEKYDVHKTTVGDIASGRSWQWLTGLEPRSIKNDTEWKR